MFGSQALYPSRVLHRWKSSPSSLIPLSSSTTTTSLSPSTGAPTPSSPPSSLPSTVLDVDSDEFKYGGRLCYLSVYIGTSPSPSIPSTSTVRSSEAKAPTADEIVARLLDEVKHSQLRATMGANAQQAPTNQMNDKK
jgi:hypothetical protein